MRRAVLIALLCLLCPATGSRCRARPSSATIEDSDGDNRLDPAPGEDYGAPREELGTASRRPPPHARAADLLRPDDRHARRRRGVAAARRVPRQGRRARSPPPTARRRASRPTCSTRWPSRCATRRARIARATQIQLVMTTGDNTDNTQCNETRWMIDVLDGGQTVNPDSGLLAGQRARRLGLRRRRRPRPPSRVPPTCTERATPGDRYDGVRGAQRVLRARLERAARTAPATRPQGENARRARCATSPGLFQRMNEPFRATGLQKTALVRGLRQPRRARPGQPAAQPRCSRRWPSAA